MPVDTAPLLSLSPAAFCEFLAGHAIRRFHPVWNEEAGSVRYWHFDDLAGFLREGLRLSRGMTQKNALAGL